MADEPKKARLVPLALAEIVGSGGFTHEVIPQEGEEVEEPQELPEGVSLEDQKSASVKLKDSLGHETDQEQEVQFFKIGPDPRLLENAAGTAPPKKEEAASEGAGSSGAEKKTPQSESGSEH